MPLSRRLTSMPALAATALALTVPVAHAQGSPGPSFAASIAPVYQAHGDLDRGGSVGATALIANLSWMTPLSPQWRAGISAQGNADDFKWDAPTAFGRHAPWGTVYRGTLSAPVIYLGDDGWQFSAIPSLEYAAESGASESAVGYGLLVSAARQWTPDLRLGLGAGAYSRIEDTTVVPFLVIDWKIAPQWRLTNPFASGPAGPAGLELQYQANAYWQLAAGGSYKSYRFRLSDSGPVKGGVGEYRVTPLFVRAGYAFADSATRLDFYAGMTVNGRAIVQDRNGGDLTSDRVGTAPMLGLVLSGRF